MLRLTEARFERNDHVDGSKPIPYVIVRVLSPGGSFECTRYEGTRDGPNTCWMPSAQEICCDSLEATLAVLKLVRLDLDLCGDHEYESVKTTLETMQ